MGKDLIHGKTARAIFWNGMGLAFLTHKPITDQPPLLFRPAAFCSGVMGKLPFVGGGVHRLDIDLVGSQACGLAFGKAKSDEVNAYPTIGLRHQKSIPTGSLA